VDMYSALSWTHL